MKIAETCLYANNLEEIESFYSEVLGLEIVMKEENRHIFFKCGDSMLLIFNPEHTLNVQTEMDGNPIPLHGTKGPGHLAFGVSPDEFEPLKEDLRKKNVPIESEVDWPNRSRSFYFRDPANNSLEIITNDMWD